MNKWMADIEKCVVSGGKDCYAVRGIAQVYGKELVQKKTEDSVQNHSSVREYSSLSVLYRSAN